MVHKIRKCRFIKIISLLALCIIYACKDQVNKIDLSEQRQYVYSVTHDQIENILIYSQDGDECYSIERKETKQGAYYINIKDISDDYSVLSGCLLEGDTVRTHKIILKPNKNYDIISITSSRTPPDTIHIYVDYKGRMIKRQSIKHA